MGGILGAADTPPHPTKHERTMDLAAKLDRINHVIDDNAAMWY